MSITEPRVHRPRVLIEESVDTSFAAWQKANPLPWTKAKPPPKKSHRPEKPKHKFRVLIDDTPDDDDGDSRAAFFASPVGVICGHLMSAQRTRRLCIRAQSQCNQQLASFIQTDLGYRSDLPKKERERIIAQASGLIEVMAQRKLPVAPGLSPDQVDDIYNIYLNTVASRTPWDNMRASQEARMEALAARLPVAAWVPSVRGFSVKGLAVIVGEVGNIGQNRRHPSGVYKRLGLAVIDGLRQGTIPPGLSKPEQKQAWIERGYKRQRRGQVWAFLDDVLLRHQIANQVALGPYGEHYLRKKAEYVARQHPYAGRAARRYMAKMFLRDLWREWCRVTPQ
jgi:hypothetical protein